jgi:hypothetical protein
VTVGIDRPFLPHQVPSAEDDTHHGAECDGGDSREVNDFANDEDDLLGLHGFHGRGSPDPPDVLS